MAAEQKIDLDRLLRQAEHLVSVASALAVALENFGINLPPPVSGGAVDQAQLRAIAVLYLASELEVVGVISAAETLTGLASRSGNLRTSIGTATPLIQTFRQGRNERPAMEVRQSFYSALFGTSTGPDHAEQRPNDKFENLLIDLCEALYKLDEQANNAIWGGVPQQIRVRSAAQRLLVNLMQVFGEMTLFAAQEILLTAKKSLEILNHSAIKKAFHTQTLWEAVAAINHRPKEAVQEYLLHVQRGQAGMTLLSWLADAATVLDADSKPIVGLDHPVISAAVEWLESSLALSETGNQTASQTTSSPWAALAG